MSNSSPLQIVEKLLNIYGLSNTATSICNRPSNEQPFDVAVKIYSPEESSFIPVIMGLASVDEKLSGPLHSKVNPENSGRLDKNFIVSAKHNPLTKVGDKSGLVILMILVHSLLLPDGSAPVIV